MMSFSSGLATPVTVRFVSKRHQVFRVCTLCPVARQPSSPTVNVSRHTDQILLFLTCTVPTQRWGFNCSFAEIFEHAGRPAPSLPDALQQSHTSGPDLPSAGHEAPCSSAAVHWVHWSQQLRHPSRAMARTAAAAARSCGEGEAGVQVQQLAAAGGRGRGPAVCSRLPSGSEP